MLKAYDSIIIGGGIAGLLTALRLSRQGQQVLVIEKDKIGTGSTFSNHGMVHSGALYVKQHGHIVQLCQEAQAAFLTLVPDAEIPVDDSLYISTSEDIKDFTALLNHYGLGHTTASLATAPELNHEALVDYEAISIKERVFSSKQILEDITSNCLSAGVEFLLGTKVTNILSENGQVIGVTVGAEQFIGCQSLVLATGLGLTQLLETFNSYHTQFLKSRLDMMVHLPQSTLRRGLIFADLDKPILMPAKEGSALGSFFGGIQPPIVGDRKFSVDFAKSQLLIDMMHTYFNEAAVDTTEAIFYMCGKTDYVGDERNEKGFINPGFHIIDHQDGDNIHGLYSIITGKMTLAFHASQKVAEAILQSPQDLVLMPAVKEQTLPAHMFAVEPWASLDNA